MASSIVNALIKTNTRFSNFLQTEPGQDFAVELEQAIDAAAQAATKVKELDDPRYESIATYAAAQHAAEARVANLLTVAQMIASNLG